MTSPRRPRLCLVTDRRQVSRDARTLHDELRALEAWIEEALEARIDLIVIRERDLDASVLRDLTRRIVARAQSRSSILVNDRIDVALASEASGVHLRADSVSVAAARALGPPGWTIGRSIHSVAEASAGQAKSPPSRPDFFVFGTVFPSRSKPGGVVCGIEGLREAVAATTVPVLAIGGIAPERAAVCAETGAAGIAAIGVFLPEGSAPDALGPMRAAKALRDAWAASSDS